MNPIMFHIEHKWGCVICGDPLPPDYCGHTYPVCCEYACYEDPGCSCEKCEIARLHKMLADANSLIGELAVTVHQTDVVSNHADPKDKTGWNVHGIETCADPLCVDALAFEANYRSICEHE